MTWTDTRHEAYRTGGELLAVQCWCRCATVRVPAAMVAAGKTESCGRKMCNALEFTALMGAGEPCDCNDRK